MTLLGRAFGTLFFALVLAPAARAQSVRGELSDARTGERLGGVLLVMLQERDSSAVSSVRTNQRGEFSLSAAQPGSYRIRAEKAGYRPAISSVLTLALGDTLRVSIRLSDQATIVLDSLLVTPVPRDAPVRARGFYERKNAASFGTFITREDIEKNRPSRTTDLLRRLIPGAQFSSGRGDGFSTRVRAGCTPAVFLDGTKVQMNGITLDDLVRPADIEGIEIYRSMSEAPPEYQGLNSGCSAILIWTRIRS